MYNFGWIIRYLVGFIKANIFSINISTDSEDVENIQYSRLLALTSHQKPQIIQIQVQSELKRYPSTSKYNLTRHKQIESISVSRLIINLTRNNKSKGNNFSRARFQIKQI